MDLLFELLHVSLGTHNKLSRVPNVREWEQLYELAEEQAITGILFHGIERLQMCMVNGKKCMANMPLELKLQWIGDAQIIQHENKMMDNAVVALSGWLTDEGIRHLIVKGQTFVALYPDSSLRLSGDIDYLVHPDEWDITYNLLCSTYGETVKENNAEKHIEWERDDVQYEMHRRLASFAKAKHQRYWEQVVEPELWKEPFAVSINGVVIPTLAPVYNVLYIFIHIFEHFVKEGIGLRQILDWRVLIENVKWKKDDVEVLEKHLEGVGLKKAFVGFGALLTDYLGLPVGAFPFEIREADHNNAPALMRNILELGNFGQNKGPLQGLRHIGRIWSQAYKFGHYAPSEVWWRIPHMFCWWGKKLRRIVKKS